MLNNSLTNRADHINLFEAYNGLQRAHASNPELGLGTTIAGIEAKYSEILRKNDLFLQVEGTFEGHQLA